MSVVNRSTRSFSNTVPRWSVLQHICIIRLFLCFLSRFSFSSCCRADVQQKQMKQKTWWFFECALMQHLIIYDLSVVLLLFGYFFYCIRCARSHIWWRQQSIARQNCIFSIFSQNAHCLPSNNWIRLFSPSISCFKLNAFTFVCSAVSAKRMFLVFFLANFSWCEIFQSSNVKFL